MTDEIGIKSETIDDGDKVATETETKTDTETKEPREGKQRSVSFNRDVHVKRFGKPRETRGASNDLPSIRKEPFTHLTEQELIEEANKVLAQAKSVSCTTDHSPEKFYSLPHRRKFKEDKVRRNSDDESTVDKKPSIERSTSDVTSKRKKERTSLSTLFRKAQRTKSPDTAPVVVKTQPIKRSKSDVSDLKSNVNIQSKPIRKRSGSESEEFLKSLRNKKTQLSPIIENSPRDDYFQKTSPLEIFEKQQLLKAKENPSENKKNVVEDIKRVNPVEKPPRFKVPEQEPKVPSRSKRAKSSEKEKLPSATDKQKSKLTKSKFDIKKNISTDQVDFIRVQEKVSGVKNKIKDSIRKIEENVYGSKDMIHSSQQPPEKPPLTRGQTVPHIVKFLKEDNQSTVPTHLISSKGTNINQPFSYTKPSTSPDPNLFTRTASPERVPSPVNKMERGVLYAQVKRDRERPQYLEHGNSKKYSPPREKYANFSDEDEGLGYEDRRRYNNNRYNYDYKNEVNENFDNIDSPIRPKFREYKLTSFNELEPTYANEYPNTEEKSHDYIDNFRGRADGMDTKRKPSELDNNKIDLDFNELSHRRQLLESRLNARKIDRDRNIETHGTITRYLTETDPIYEANKRMKATEKYVNETAKYYRHTLERDGYTESILTEDYNKYDSDNHRQKYNTESRTFLKVPNGDINRREFVESEKPRFTDERMHFPPEPEYEPPSLEFKGGKPIHSPDVYQEKKYKAKKHFTSSHDILQTGQKYKVKDEYFGKRKGHYASNPEIAQEREDDYANLRYQARQAESYHNSLRRNKGKDRRHNEDYQIRRHDSGDSRDYYRENTSPRRYDIDNRLVDSGIENDFRKDSSGDIHRNRRRLDYSDEDVRDTSLFLDSERKHAEDNYPSEQIYANGEYIARFEDFRSDKRKEYMPREKSGDNGSHLDSKGARYDISPTSRDDKVSSKPPKAKKLSGLEKVKQLFSRDSSKKSKKEKDIVQQKSRTRVLKSPEHLEKDEPEYRRYTDPEPSDLDIKKKSYDSREVSAERRYRSSREDLDRYDRSPRSPGYRINDSDRKYRDKQHDERRMIREERGYKEEKRRYHSSDRESDLQRASDLESELRRTMPKTEGPLDSPALAERYRGRRRLATPSPTPSPPRRQPTPAQNSSGGWFKSLDRIGRKKDKSNKVEEKESVITTEDESFRKTYKPGKPLNSPMKNLRFFGDTDPESDTTIKQNMIKKHSTLRKTKSNSSNGVDEVDKDISKSYDEKEDSPRTKQHYKRNLHNISEIQSASEAESQFGRKINMKPPMSPYDRRSRSQSSSKTLKASKSDLRKYARNDDRGSSSELRSSQQDINRELKPRRRTPAPNSGESSTEGDSSHQSQRSVVYLHATTVGDIPDPGRMSRNRSRDDVSSLNSSNFQVKSTTRSFSLFGPRTPKHYNEQHDVHYSQKPRSSKSKETGVFKKSSSTKNLNDDRPSTLQKTKSHSQTTLARRPQNNRLTSSSTTLNRKPEKRSENSLNATMSRRNLGQENKGKSQSSEILSRTDSERISRSISMPKDSKKAGWFKLSNKNKKQELNTRVR